MAVDLIDTPHPNPEVEKDWQDFWLSRTFREGFTLNDMKAELSDYHRYLTETAKVYVEITGGRISKQNTTADAVIGEYQAVLQEAVDEAVEDATQHLKAEIAELEGEKEKLRSERDEILEVGKRLLDMFDEAIGVSGYNRYILDHRDYNDELYEEFRGAINKADPRPTDR